MMPVLSDLTPKQRATLDFYRQFIRENGYCPSYAEVAAAKDWPKCKVVQRVMALKARGLVRHRPRRHRAVEVVDIAETSPT